MRWELHFCLLANYDLRKYYFGVSIHTAGRMHSIGESMHTAGFGVIFYLLILLLYNCFQMMDFDGYGFLARDVYA